MPDRYVSFVQKAEPTTKTTPKEEFHNSTEREASEIGSEYLITHTLHVALPSAHLWSQSSVAWHGNVAILAGVSFQVCNLHISFHLPVVCRAWPFAIIVRFAVQVPPGSCYMTKNVRT